MRHFVTFLLILLSFSVSAQKKQSTVITAGPMIGHVDLRTATIWMQFEKNVSQAQIFWEKKGLKNQGSGYSNFIFSDEPYKTGTAIMTGLKPATTYTYRVTINILKPQSVATGEVTTQQLWQWRKQAPDFSFITGSCAYFNQPE